jgi:uncharacterized DUF497 family protein
MNNEVRHGGFLWNTEKEKTNVRQHGLSFQDAMEAFADPRRIIARDDAHSTRILH